MNINKIFNFLIVFLISFLIFYLISFNTHILNKTKSIHLIPTQVGELDSNIISNSIGEKKLNNFYRLFFKFSQKELIEILKSSMSVTHTSKIFNNTKLKGDNLSLFIASSILAKDLDIQVKLMYANAWLFKVKEKTPLYFYLNAAINDFYNNKRNMNYDKNTNIKIAENYEKSIVLLNNKGYNPDAQYRLGIIYLRLGNKIKAANVFYKSAIQGHKNSIIKLNTVALEFFYILIIIIIPIKIIIYIFNYLYRKKYNCIEIIFLSKDNTLKNILNIDTNKITEKINSNYLECSHIYKYFNIILKHNHFLKIKQLDNYSASISIDFNKNIDAEDMAFNVITLLNKEINLSNKDDLIILSLKIIVSKKINIKNIISINKKPIKNISYINKQSIKINKNEFEEAKLLMKYEETIDQNEK